MKFSFFISNTSLLVILVLSLSGVSCSKKFLASTTPKESVILPEKEIKADTVLKKEENIEDHARGKLQQFLESRSGTEIGPVRTTADMIIESASKYMGVPHCMGGTTARCMDCSGLIYRVFSEHGILLPHSSQEQSGYGTVITQKTSLVKGDLVFFSGSYSTGNFISHSGIYTGNNKFIHTSSSKGVTISSLDDPWWKNKFAFGTRLLPMRDTAKTGL